MFHFLPDNSFSFLIAPNDCIKAILVLYAACPTHKPTKIFPRFSVLYLSPKTPLSLGEKEL